MRDCGVTAEQADALYKEVAAEMDEAIQFAQESPDPDPATVGEGLWATRWYTGMKMNESSASRYEPRFSYTNEIVNDLMAIEGACRLLTSWPCPPMPRFASSTRHGDAPLATPPQ